MQPSSNSNFTCGDIIIDNENKVYKFNFDISNTTDGLVYNILNHEDINTEMPSDSIILNLFFDDNKNRTIEYWFE